MDRQRLAGFLLAALGVLVLSPDAALNRFLALEVEAVLFWRGLGLALVLGLATLVVKGFAGFLPVLRSGWQGFALALTMLCNPLLFTYSVELTQPAHTLALLAATPLAAALMSWWLLGERMGRLTWVASGFVGLGVWITLRMSLGGGGNLLGDLMALVLPFVLGFQLSLIRKMGLAFVWPFFAIGGLMLACIMLLVTRELHLDAWSGPNLPLASLVLLVAPVSFLLISLAPRYISGPEVGLFLLLEAALGPLWVWLAVGLAPTRDALMGGALILVTLLVYSSLTIGRKQAQ